MKKGWIKITVIVLLIIIVVIALYLGSKGGKDNIISRILNNNTEKKESITAEDTISGVYVYKKNLGKTYTISSSCHISSLDKYIVLMNDDYFIYNKTCLGTFFEGQGKKNELEINKNETSNLNEIIYNGLTFTKDVYTKEFKPTTTKEQMDAIQTVDFNYLKFIIDNTEIPGHYYIIDANIAKAISKYGLIVNYTSDTRSLRIYYGDSLKYNLNIDDTNNLPEFYAMGNYIAVIENQSGRKVLKILDDTNTSIPAYNSDNEFPITIDNRITLDSNDKVYISCNESFKTFDVLITKNNTFCTDDGSNPNEVAYYRYKIEYNYKVKKWQMNFITIGYNKDGCAEVKKIMGE